MTAAVDHAEMMEQLKGLQQNIADVIGESEVVYTDLPCHSNVGDLLIMQGTLKFLSEKKIKITSLSTCHDFSESSVNRDSTILLHGGGNLGDLYTLHQKFRERVVSGFLKNKIIILPQSIHFDSIDNYNACCEVFSAHENLHIFVRDRISYDQAKGMSKHVYLMPDMAHYLYPVKSVPQESVEDSRLIIQRVDKEAKRALEISEPATATDWPMVVGKFDIGLRVISRLMKLSTIIKTNKWVSPYLARVLISYSDFLIDKAVALYSKHGVIETDRLHGHILASLMDKENVVHDNSYGKNSGYIKEWTGKSNIVSFSENCD